MTSTLLLHLVSFSPAQTHPVSEPFTRLDNRPLFRFCTGSNEDNNFSGTKQGINLPLYHNEHLLAVIGITGIPDKVRSYAYLAERITNLLIREQELNQYSRRQADKSILSFSLWSEMKTTIRNTSPPVYMNLRLISTQRKELFLFAQINKIQLQTALF